MPHPDYQIVDVPLRLDQVAALMRLIDDAVATGLRDHTAMAGPYAGLLGTIPEDAPYLRPGPNHWIYKQMAANR